MNYFAVFKRQPNARRIDALKVVQGNGGEIDFAATDILVGEQQGGGVLGANWTLIEAATPAEAIAISAVTPEGQTARPPYLRERFRPVIKVQSTPAHRLG